MLPYQQRVVEEKQELDKKIDKLALFLKGEFSKFLPSEEQGRLQRQYHIMIEYSGVLAERITHFP